jgi:hypothetical protein
MVISARNLQILQNFWQFHNFLPKKYDYFDFFYYNKMENFQQEKSLVGTWGHIKFISTLTCFNTRYVGTCLIPAKNQSY